MKKSKTEKLMKKKKTLIGGKEFFDRLLGEFVVSGDEFIEDTRWKPPYHYKYGIKKTCLWYKRTFRI